jgi:hypothetical protein
MKKCVMLKLKFLKIIISIAAAVSMNIFWLNAQPFKLFGVSDLKCVFEDGYNLPATFDTIKLFGIRGEILSGQCAFQAKNNMTNITVEVSALKNQTTGTMLPSNVTGWDFVGSIPLAKNAPNQPKDAVTRVAPAKFPDYLLAEKQISINKGLYQSVWLTISVPETAGAGTYSGKITVKCVQGEQSLPLYVTVYPLTMPAKRHLKVTEWYNTGSFSKNHGIQEEYSDAWFAMLRKYADNMVAHRQNVFQVPMNTIQITRSKNSELEFDFTRFDQIAQVFWNTKKMDYLETGELAKFEKDWYSTKILPKGFSVKNSENGEKITLPGTEVIPFLLPAFESHLRQKGWLRKTLFHIKDEPSVYNTQSWREMSAYIHKYAPDLKRVDAIETSFIVGDLEVACPQIDHLGTWYEDFKKQANAGTELWIYTVGIYQATSYPNKTIDMPVIDSRIMHWVNYQYDLTGYLHWGWNQWTENPYQEVGMHIGDGWHVYPVKDGVLNSLRWEQMRNGIQDYEYLYLLEEKITALKDSLGSGFVWIDPKRTGKEIAGKVVMNLAKHTYDPQILYNAKKQIIRELLEFNTSPKIYFQVNPNVNTILKSGSTVEIYGWTEPGTKITVNDKEFPVNNQGLFLGILDLTTNRHMIKVKAGNSKGSKEIIREFTVEN